MTERTARRAADNNVVDVINTIEAYGCGPIRALAQDPPQNSLDARRNKGKVVHVIYSLIERSTPDGEKMKILTITDSGTTGLDGPILSNADLTEREHRLGTLEIGQDENWAAFEANRYTKTGQEKLGSRGQGKYAYLYHSRHPVSQGGADQMIILYDTLTTNESNTKEYRLGVRYHNPATKVIEPPFLGKEAEGIISTSYEDDHFNIPLQLEPLTQLGTRIIIPFLSNEALEAIQNGELLHWLQSEWWRAIQKGDLRITLVDEIMGSLEEVSVLDRWNNEPWRRRGSDYFIKENIDLPSRDKKDKASWRIKRIVLSAGDQIDDLEDYPAQFNGIQLLRGGQWIVTLDPKEYLDLIPKEDRSGFCGFVEFEQKLEGELRAIEKPAHDGFDGRKPLYKEIKNVINGFVEKFSIEQGWFEETSRYDPRQDDLITKITGILGIWKSPPPPEVNSKNWSCVVKANERSYSWGEKVSISAICYGESAMKGKMIWFQPSLIKPDGTIIDLPDNSSQRLNGRNEERSSAGATFNELLIQVPMFKETGRYKVAVDCYVDSDKVVTGSCSFYVNEEPPMPPQGVFVRIVASNKNSGKKEIPLNGELFWETYVRNNTENPIIGNLYVTIEDQPEILMIERVSIDGVALEERAQPVIFSGMRKVKELNLKEGKHKVLVSVDDADGKTLASSYDIIVIGEGDDTQQEPELPFELYEEEDKQWPRWELQEPRRSSDEYMLIYSGKNRIYQTLRDSHRKYGNKYPAENYMMEIYCEAIIEWAYCEFTSKGDEGRLQSLIDGVSRLDNKTGEIFEGLIEKFIDETIDPIEYTRIHRKLSSIIVDSIQERI